MNKVDLNSPFRRVFQTEPELKKEFGKFFRTIFHSLDKKKVFQAVEEILKDSTKSDEQIYVELQGRIQSLQKTPSFFWRIWSLFVLKTGMGKQANELMKPFRKEAFQDYLEVYDRRYLNTMRKAVGLPLKGKTVAVCDRDSIGFSDRLQAGSLLSRYPYKTHVGLNDSDCQDPLKEPEKTHKPIDQNALENNSIDLVNCLGGFHHIPGERVGSFVKSLHRVLRPGGVLLFRDHATQGDENLVAIASLVHTFVNLADGVSWEVESKELRHLAPMRQWENRLNFLGFTRVSKKELVLKDDPTANAMTIFVKAPKNLEELKQAATYRKDSKRSKDGTRATWIEWGNVRFSKQYAAFLQKHHDYAFDYAGHLKQHWKYFYHYVKESWKDPQVGAKDLFLSGNMAMNLFILTAATVQCVAGAIFSFPNALWARWKHGEKWRSVANLSALERFYAKTELEYSNFIDHTPFYCFPYIGKIKEMWKTVWGAKQHWTTKCGDFLGALTGTISFAAKALVSAPIKAFYTSEANKEPDLIQILIKDPENKVQNDNYETVYQLEDGHKILLMPRYRPFTEFCKEISKEDSVELIEIGGQSEISLDILLQKNEQSPEIANSQKIYEMDKLQDEEERRFATYQVPVAHLKNFIKSVREVEYIHE